MRPLPPAAREKVVGAGNVRRWWLLAGLALGLLVVAVPAQARDHRFYVGGGLTSVAVTGELDGAASLRSAHDSTNVLLPGENIPASLTSLVFAGRFMLPLGDTFEAMGRLGLGPTTLEYDQNTVLPGAALRLDSSFSGLGLVAGAGMALTFDPVGVELSFDRHQVRLSQVETADRRYDLRDRKELTVDTINLIVTVHLGPKP